jgi:hypothetical protein
MAFEIGDVIIFSGTPGHVGMIYSAGRGEAAQIIHAQRRGGFHIDENVTTNASGSSFSYLVNGRDWVFRPPWAAKPHINKGVKQAALQAVAREIRDHAQYGVYRAVRLFLGSSSFGDGARARLAKYKQRRQDGFPRNKFVTTVTCSEAVILCYQMTFDEDDDPFFIKLDAAHSMPSTLRQWLSTRWEKIQGPS